MIISIYMTWSGRTHTEKQAQLDVDSKQLSGHIGVLKVGYSQTSLIELIKDLFAEEYWDGKKPLRYNFKANKEINEQILKEFAKIDPSQVSEFAKLLKEHGIEAVMIKDKSRTQEFKDTWITNIRRFLEKGERLQNEKKAPKIYISG